MNSLPTFPTIFFPAVARSEMLSAEFIGACLEAKFSPLVSDDMADEEIFRHLRQLKITSDTVAVAAGETYTPRTLFLVEKAAGFLCVIKT